MPALDMCIIFLRFVTAGDCELYVFNGTLAHRPLSPAIGERSRQFWFFHAFVFSSKEGRPGQTVGRTDRQTDMQDA